MQQRARSAPPAKSKPREELPEDYRQPWQHHGHVMEETGRWYDRRYGSVHWCLQSGIWPWPNCITEEAGKPKTDRWCAPQQKNGKNKLKHAFGCKCGMKDQDNPDVDNRGGAGNGQGPTKK